MGAVIPASRISLQIDLFLMDTFLIVRKRMDGKLEGYASTAHKDMDSNFDCKVSTIC
jgi:hypothetical protein